jgi:hypothetical protein
MKKSGVFFCIYASVLSVLSILCAAKAISVSNDVAWRIIGTVCAGMALLLIGSFVIVLAIKYGD